MTRYDHVFRSKEKAECNLRERAMKGMKAVESDSVKSATRKAGQVENAEMRNPKYGNGSTETEVRK